MSWRTGASTILIARPSRRWLQTGVPLLLSLALTITACGASSIGGGATTPTPKPTSTPAPCTGWRIVSSPNMADYAHSDLRSVSAVSPTQAWAVGLAMDATQSPPTLQSLVEEWDGTTWRLVASAGFDSLNGVAALAPNDVWAVGGQFNYGAVGGSPPPERPLILHWDGTSWSVVPSARPADANAVELESVAAISTHDVWAVGRQDAGSAHLLQPLVEHWDGSASHVITSPLPQGATNGSLSSVTRIPGTKQLWAVGQWSSYSVPTLPQPLIEQWTGAAWQIVTSPTLPSGALGGTWKGVVALSASNAWAVGSYWVKNPVDLHPLIGHWDGATWATVASPDTFGELNSVAAAGANDVRAAGTHLTGSGASSGDGRRVPLIEQWDGSAWQIVATPEPSGATSTPLSITTDGAGAYWAVGSSLSANAATRTQTLILHCP
ncbi:MAG TPA: hypothetical protein VGF38_03620 [Ktedonobacterales bacterium]